MSATLSWLDFTAADRDKVRRVLALFGEQGTVDELGLGSLRDAFSNALFPGTSVLHTRLRYLLFIPWIYQSIATRARGRDVVREGRRLEVDLIDSLAASEDTQGIIGKHARHTLAQLASSAYWAFLVHLGIFIPAQSQGWLHTHFDRLVRQQHAVGRADDPGVIEGKHPLWHPRLPGAPKRFPAGADFALTREEAEFLQGRIEERCRGSLLAWLAREGPRVPAKSLWDEPKALNAPDTIAGTVALARRFSQHLEGAPLLYNLQLAERRHTLQPSPQDAERIDKYREELRDWATREAAESAFENDALWAFVARTGATSPFPQRSFVDSWNRRVVAIGPMAVIDDLELRRLIALRERQLKGDRRARIVDTGRLLDWSGRVGVGRMQFRWPQVRQLLIDLQRGLKR